MLAKKPFSIAKTFGRDDIPAHITIEGNEERCEYVPTEDPHYVHRKDQLRIILNWLSAPIVDGLFLFGPRGAGKTSSILQVASKLNIPVYEKTFHDRLTLNELVGSMALVDGSTFIQYGPLAKAMGVDGRPGIFLANEIDKASPGVLTGLNEVMQGNPVDVLGREVLRPLPGFRVAVTANTNMLGENLHIHRGSRIQDPSFVDRFWVMRVTYPTPEEERNLVSRKVSGLASQILDKMIEVANEVRHLSAGEVEGQPEIEVTLSTRTLVRWADATLRFKSLHAQGINPIFFALDLAFLALAEPPTQEAVREITRNVFGDLTIERAA